MTEAKNKLTLDDIEAAILKEEDFKLGQKTTVVLLTLKNGFEVIGKASCVDPVNYNYEIGIRIARQRVLDEVWLIEGYKLQCDLLRDSAVKVPKVLGEAE